MSHIPRENPDQTRISAVMIASVAGGDGTPESDQIIRRYDPSWRAFPFGSPWLNSVTLLTSDPNELLRVNRRRLISPLRAGSSLHPASAGVSPPPRIEKRPPFQRLIADFSIFRVAAGRPYPSESSRVNRPRPISPLRAGSSLHPASAGVSPPPSLLSSQAGLSRVSRIASAFCSRLVPPGHGRILVHFHPGAPL